jgi:hypothetical protein
MSHADGSTARRPLAWVSAAALAIAVAGCGAAPPQAPPGYEKKLGVSTSGISTACGKAYLLRAFGGSHATGMKGLDAAAAHSAHTLALVDRRDPRWIFLGETVRAIVSDSASMLDSCGLHRARARLLRETRGR